MWARRYIITPAIFVALALPIFLQAQECSFTRGWGKFHLLWPYSAEYRERHEYTDYEGRPSPPQEEVRLISQDSQGRLLERGTSANGSSHSWVLDPVASQEIAWNTVSAKAKILIWPTPVANRRSCWRGPDSERYPVRHEPRIGVSGVSCAPASDHQWGCRDACAGQRRANAVPPIKEGFPKCDPTEPGGTAEDLGTEVIQGVAAHGCRTTTPFPKGKRKLRDIWSDENCLTLRRIEEDPTDARYFEDLISLNRAEPPLSTFQPPEGYEIVTLEMNEIPCDQPKASSP